MPKAEQITWGERELIASEKLSLNCGPLQLRASFESDEISLASSFDQETESEAGAEIGTRWAIPSNTSEYSISPALPKLPVVVAPETPFHLVPGAMARVFLRIPVSVVFRIGSKIQLLEEFPTETLSQTWFGEVDNGEVCYWLPAGLLREPIPSLAEDSIQAPVTIRNEALETLQVTKLCLRVAHLSVYEAEQQLWATETEVKFQGGILPSKVTVWEGSPPEARDAILVGEPREKGPSSKVGRTFRSLRQWTIDLLDVD